VEVPGNSLALTILVRRQVECLGFFQGILEVRDLLFLFGRDDVDRFEVFVDIDS
jgi:phage FluMu protein gp41